MRTCESCGRQNPMDRDFCECGEYLRWEPTNYKLQAVPPPQAPAEETPPAPPAPAPAEPTPPPPPDYKTRQTASPRPAVPDPPAPAAPAAPPPPVPERTPHMPISAVTPDMPAAAAAITLRLPQDDGGAGEGPVGLAVAPGERARVMALVRNQSQIVDNYDVVVHGLPREWWTVTPGTVYLVPYGTAGTYEQEIEIALHPPRSPEAEARRWDLQVGVQSRAANAEVAQAPLTLGILPYEEYAIRVKPERKSGRRQAKYDIRIANTSNAASKLALDAADSDGECEFAFGSDAVEVPVGATKDVKLTVRPPRQIWIGRPLDRQFEISSGTGEAGEKLLEAKAENRRRGGLKLPPGVSKPQMSGPRVNVGPSGIDFQGPHFRGPHVGQKSFDLKRGTLGLRALKRPDGAGAAPAAPAVPLLPTQAIFRQKPWLPWWLSIVIPLLALLGLLALLLAPKNVTVPEVVGLASAAEAQEKIEDVGLQMEIGDPVVSKKVPPGSVVDQTPDAGKEREEGSVVTVHVAVGTGNVKVPDLAGMTLSEADKALREVKLTKGALSKPDADPNQDEITSTLPEAGETVKVGTPVDLYFGEDKPAAKKDDEKGGGGAVAPPGEQGGGGALTVPELDPADEAGYTETLTGLGLTVSETERQINEAPAGTVFKTDPEVGAEVAAGDSVKLFVSAGFPTMAFDREDDILLVSSETGKALGPVAKTAAPEKDPTWSADGSTIVYTLDGQLVAVDAENLDDGPVVLRPDDEDYGDPSFAPRKAVLAVSRVNGNDRDLCVGRVKSGSYKPSCIEDDTYSTGFAHWSPDGKTLLVPSVTTDFESGVVRYESDIAFSRFAEDWGEGEFITEPSSDRYIRDIAISPDGRFVAAAANLADGGPFVLYLAAAAELDALEDVKPLKQRACKVAWLDSTWLAVVQFDDVCDSSLPGEIVRMPVTDTSATTPITTDGDNPTFRPLDSEG